MKRERLDTLSEFVEYLYSEHEPIYQVSTDELKSEYFDIIVNYM